MQQCTLKSVGVTKMRRTSVEGGKEKVECRMCRMMWSSHSQMRKLRRSKLSNGGARYYLFPDEDLIVNGDVFDKAIGNHIEMNENIRVV
jgi:hypothetical protein